MTTKQSSSFDIVFKMMFRDKATGAGKYLFGICLRIIETCAAAMPALIVVLTLSFLQQTQSALAIVAIICVTTFAVRSTVLMWSSIQFFDFGFDLGAHTRKSIVESLFIGSLGKIDAFGPSKIVSLMSDAAYEVETFASERSADFVATVLGVVVIIGATFFFDWRLALTLIGVLGFAGLFLSKTQTMAKRLWVERQVKTGSVSIALGEFIGGMSVLRMFGTVGEAKQVFEESVAALHEMWLRYEKTLTPLAICAGALMDLAPVAAVILAAILYESDLISADAMIGFSVFALAVGVPLKRILIYFTTLDLAVSSFSRLHSFFEGTRPPSVTSETIKDASIPALPAIEFRDVSFTYPDTEGNNSQVVLQDVSFSLPQGGLTAIVGPSGSGKSTVLKLIMRHWDPKTGEIFVEGDNVKSFSIEDIATRVSSVPQEVYLFRDSVRANLQIANPTATDAELWHALDCAQATPFINDMPGELDAEIGEGGLSLSGGERQRLSIARAMLKEAPLLLLDEPTASIDGASARRIMAALGSEKSDKTVIVVSHALFSIKHADQILVLNNGRLEETGTHETLLRAKGLYHRLWTTEENAKSWSVG